MLVKSATERLAASSAAGCRPVLSRVYLSEFLTSIRYDRNPCCIMSGMVVSSSFQSSREGRAVSPLPFKFDSWPERRSNACCRRLKSLHQNRGAAKNSQHLLYLVSTGARQKGKSRHTPKTPKYLHRGDCVRPAFQDIPAARCPSSDLTRSNTSKEKGE